jgi:hypothetical protein
VCVHWEEADEKPQAGEKVNENTSYADVPYVKQKTNKKVVTINWIVFTMQDMCVCIQAALRLP